MVQKAIIPSALTAHEALKVVIHADETSLKATTQLLGYD